MKSDGRDWNVLAYNIHGNLQKKLKDIDFGEYCKQFDVVFLLETHEEKEIISYGELDTSFDCEMVAATRKSVKGRASGGVLVAIKRSLNHCLKIRKLPTTELFVEVKTNNQKRIIIPKYLCYNNWNSDLLKMYDMVMKVNENNVMIVGDLNARIGSFTTGNIIDNGFIKDVRQTKDLTVNQQGEKLIEFIQDFNMEGHWEMQKGKQLL